MSVVRDKIEREIARIFMEVLGIEEPQRDANFFDLGGTSLLAVRLGERIMERFEVLIPVRTIFEGASVAELASAIEAAIARRPEAGLP